MDRGKHAITLQRMGRTKAALKIVLIYAAFASAWILFSDKALVSLIRDPDTVLWVSIAKGWIFVAVTALMLFVLIRRLLGEVLAESMHALQAHAETTRAKNLLDNIADSSPDAIYAKDLEGRYLLINREAARIMGKPPEQIVGRDGSDFFPPEQAHSLRADDLTVIERKQVSTFEVTLNTPGGERILSSTKGPLRDEAGKVIGMFGISRDITERRAKEQTMEKSEEKFSKVFSASPATISIASMKDGRYVDVNDAFMEVTGYQKSEVIGRTSSELKIWVTEGDKRRYVEALEKQSSLRNFECRFRMKNDEIRTFLVSAELIELEGEPCRLNFILDITERKQAEQAIHNLAYFDTLTKLPNRRLLMDRLGHALVASNRSLEFGALMILDLDNFKVLNDTKGHDVGDRLLIAVAQRIIDAVRPEDTVSRLGGDEYVVMIESLGTDDTAAANQVEIVAGKIRAALNQPYKLSESDQVYYSTSSIGVTLFSGNGLPIDVLLKQADMALYQAKGAGRNTVRFFNPAMQASIESRAHMEAALRNSLELNEFHLFYQPQIDQHGLVVGAEALLRWLPANQPPVPPVQFIPLAEDTGLIIPLGLWVLQTACAQLQAWSADAATRHLQISINVSARQFRQVDFVEQVFDALKQSGINPGLLKLELTESLVLENVHDVITRMEQIRAFGVTFSLDDFGTGFSSLSYLKQLPLDEVKIDQSFVRDITTDPSDAAIVRAIIAMSRSLGIHVIAEGVETAAQLQFLKENGCTNFQGYLFSKPIPIENWQHTKFDPV